MLTRHSAKLILAMPALWVVLFMLVPYGVLLTYSFWIEKYPLFVPAFQFGNYWTLLTDPQYVHLLLRRLKIAGLVSAASLLLAYPFAYFLVFRPGNDRIRVFLVMGVVAPLRVSYLLRAYVWKTILGIEGILNSFLMSIGVIDEPSGIFLYNQFAMVVTLTYATAPGGDRGHAAVHSRDRRPARGADDPPSRLRRDVRGPTLAGAAGGALAAGGASCRYRSAAARGS